MNINIRNETINDYFEVEKLTREAFWNLYFPGCVEHFLVHQIRNHPDYINELDFIAESNGEIVGSIIYTKAWLINEKGQELEIMSFGPLSVLPEFQRKGIGSLLVSHTLKEAQNKGVKSIVIFGDPHNYCKHGFKSGKDFNISDMNGKFPYGMLAIELEDQVLAGHHWKFKFSDALNVNEEEVELFDKGFAEKLKGYQYSQAIFSIAFRSYVN